MTGLHVRVSRHPVKAAIGWNQVERGLHGVRHLLGHYPRADGWTVRWTSTVIPRTTLISQTKGSNAQHFLVEAHIRRPLQRRVARLVDVEIIGTDEMG